QAGETTGGTPGRESTPKRTARLVYFRGRRASAQNARSISKKAMGKHRTADELFGAGDWAGWGGWAKKTDQAGCWTTAGRPARNVIAPGPYPPPKGEVAPAGRHHLAGVTPPAARPPGRPRAARAGRGPRRRRPRPGANSPSRRSSARPGRPKR